MSCLNLKETSGNKSEEKTMDTKEDELLVEYKKNELKCVCVN